MKSKIEKRNYVVLLDGERYPSKMNRKFTDKSIAKLKSALETVKSVMKETYDKDYSLYDLLFQRQLELSLDIDEGRSWKIDSSIESLALLQEALHTQNDEILPIEECSYLEDLGFRLWVWHEGVYVYEKQIIESDEQDVVEEIVRLKDGKLVRRLRTTLWEKTPHGKSSTSITYKKLRMTKQLEKAFYNSLKEHESKCNRSY